MSLHGYHVSVNISAKDHPFESLVMAAMRKADTVNGARLALAFPEVHRELRARYDAPLGVIPEDGEIDMDALAESVRELRGQA